jgi:fermentation-respiration switch protein FrsA (DUF1100 family)
LPKTATLLLNTVLVGLCVYFTLVLSFYFLQGRYVFQPKRVLTGNPEQRGLAFEGVYFQSADGVRLHGWFLPHSAPRATVLFLRGNAGNISHDLDTLEILRNLGLSVLIFDYRGYGYSFGQPGEAGTYQDALGAWRYLTEKRGIPADRIILFGRSLGGAVAAWLGQQHMPRGLVLESTFTSLPEVAEKLFPLFPARWLIQYDYNTLARLPAAHCPVLIVHSVEDEIFPFSWARRLLAVAHEPKYFLQIQGSHQRGFMEYRVAYVAGWESFLERGLGL